MMYTTAPLLKLAAICLLALASLVKASAQSFDLHPEEIAAAHAALLSNPDSLAEARFFNAFPKRGEDLTLLYETHDLTAGTTLDLSDSSNSHISAFWNLRLIPAEVLVEKAVAITCGLRVSRSVSQHWQWHLRQALAQPDWRDVIADEVARLRSGHQFEFWAMVWSSAEADSSDQLFDSLQPILLTRHPHTAAISDRAFHLFHNVVRSWETSAQQVSFQTFLSEHERRESFDSTSFNSPYKFIEQESRYAEFLPPTDEECRCKPENVRWTKGSYIKHKNFIAVILQRYCMNYQDGNEQWFIENDGDDYMLITYSLDGKMLDYKTVGHYGAAYPIRVTSSDNGLSLVVEQKVLDDCSLLHQYKNLTYTVSTRKYTLKSNGKIKERLVDAPHKEVVDVMSSVKQFTFEQFLSYFQKWDKPYVDHTLFTPSSERAELPFASCLSLIPDTLDHNCWSRDIQWISCQYIENENSFFCFLIKDCPTPKTGFLPYTGYLALEFHKNGTFKCARNIYHSDDDSIADNDTIHILITKALEKCVKRASN